MNQDDKKFICPYCGYEMDKRQNRCENCASILDAKVENENFVSERYNHEQTQNPINEVPNVEPERRLDEAISENRPPVSNNVGQKFEAPKNQPTNNQYNQPNKIMPPPPKPLSNTVKVALTAVCVMVPAIGQFAGIILSIMFMNSGEELRDCEDRRSFGLALLIACIISFVVACIGCFGFFIFAASLGGRY